MDIIKEIFKHKHEIVAIRIDGVCYDIYYMNLDDVISHEQLADDDVIIEAYLLEDDVPAIYNFTVADIKNAKSVKLYKFVEV